MAAPIKVPQTEGPHFSDVIFSRKLEILSEGGHCSCTGCGAVARYFLLHFPLFNKVLGIEELFSIAWEIHQMSSLKTDATGLKLRLNLCERPGVAPATLQEFCFDMLGPLRRDHFLSV